jgi:hypothetical protein
MSDQLTASELKSVAKEYIQQEYSDESKMIRIEQHGGKAYVGLKIKSYNRLINWMAEDSYRILEIDPSTKHVLSEVNPNEKGKEAGQALQERMDEYTGRGTDGGFPTLMDDADDLDLSDVDIPEPDDDL